MKADTKYTTGVITESSLCLGWDRKLQTVRMIFKKFYGVYQLTRFLIVQWMICLDLVETRPGLIP